MAVAQVKRWDRDRVVDELQRVARRQRATALTASAIGVVSPRLLPNARIQFGTLRAAVEAAGLVLVRKPGSGRPPGRKNKVRRSRKITR